MHHETPEKLSMPAEYVIRKVMRMRLKRQVAFPTYRKKDACVHHCQPTPLCSTCHCVGVTLRSEGAPKVRPVKERIGQTVSKIMHVAVTE